MKGKKIKFATIMANCKKILNYTENNDICLRGPFLPHTVYTYQADSNNYTSFCRIYNRTE